MESLLEPGLDFPHIEEKFPVEPSDSSVFGEEARAKDRTISESEAMWLRWQIALLSNEVRRLHGDPQPIVRENSRFQEFRQRFENFLRSPAKQQADLRQGIVAAIRSSPAPTIYLQEILRQCSTGGGPNGLDLGIDILSCFGPEVLIVFQSFVETDRVRWGPRPMSHHVNDDVGYMLLRALARSNVPDQEKLTLIRQCLADGTSSIREAATHALGDMASESAKELLKQAASRDRDSLVRESAQEALADLGS